MRLRSRLAGPLTSLSILIAACSGGEPSGGTTTGTTSTGGATSGGGDTTATSTGMGGHGGAPSTATTGGGGTGGAPDPCKNGEQNGTETGVDCGGGCPPCAPGAGCLWPGDCDSGVCDQAICQTPTCADAVKNGAEPDVDCGGPCPKCLGGKACASGSDCISGQCDANVCAAPPPKESIAVVDACDLPQVPPPDGAVNEAVNLTYTSAGGLERKLDIAWPLGPGPHPLVFIVHSGVWFAGDKSARWDEVRAFASLGYVAAAPNYRLSKDGHTSPAAQSDVRCALRWLRANAATWGIDPARVVAIGNSAGGHLAASITDPSPLDDGTCETPGSTDLDGVVGYYGVYDFTTFADVGPSVGGYMSLFLGPNGDPALASPIKHLHPGSPPQLLLHGTQDTEVYLSASEKMHAAAQAVAVPSTYVTVPAIHGFKIFSSGTSLPATCTMLAFVKTRLAP